MTAFAPFCYLQTLEALGVDTRPIGLPLQHVHQSDGTPAPVLEPVVEVPPVDLFAGLAPAPLSHWAFSETPTPAPVLEPVADLFAGLSCVAPAPAPLLHLAFSETPTPTPSDVSADIFSLCKPGPPGPLPPLPPLPPPYIQLQPVHEDPFACLL
jgi:hypothetical protein